ncbi:putative amidohydrolase [Dyadobacter jejuensis]|uniref:Omega-amidase YafV n=1 Tax=Dyadobacter jejuensis TaxID=1082580 RepID=A0A316ARL4_9BACT|nr:amidohydrolase [Dyadobacter jejuensis]PWJ59959.1 putative amidohydrolase [Dyadobacter jejuensis]
MEVKNDLRVALVQTDLYWENSTANFSAIEEKIAAIEEPFDLLLLPEMFSTGFTMNTQWAEPMNLTATKWLKQMAAKSEALVVGSVMIQEAKAYYNRVFCVFPDGSIQTYDKRHLFRMGEEHRSFSAGDTRLVVEWKGWRICPLVCYDLRFPVWSRNNPDSPYDLLLYVANWPAARAYAWKSLLVARAIENQAYVVGVNRVGVDGQGIAYQGDSRVIGCSGEVALDMGDRAQEAVVSISYSFLQAFREKFPFLQDADPFQIQ